MINDSYDSSQNEPVTNEHCAGEQSVTGMEQFSLPMYDAWQSSIDFMLWPLGSCEYGSHVASCPNMPTPTDSNFDSQDIPCSPYSTIHSHTMSNMSYSTPCTSSDSSNCFQRSFNSSYNPLSEQMQTFRTKDIPMSTPVWRPSGPLPRFSEKL